MSKDQVNQILSQIYTQRKKEPLSILTLAEPLLDPSTQQPLSQPPSTTQQNGTRGSNVSSDANTSTVSPSALAADLAHYRDLFSKLRFSYLEQVTKEKYLRGIVGEPPILATSEENSALEEKLSVMKSELQAKKRGVEALVTEIEALARELAEKYDVVSLAVTQLETLPDEVDELEMEVEELKRQLAEREGEGTVSDDPRMNLGMEETERLLEEQRARDEELRRQVERLEKEMPAKLRECEKAERELGEIEMRRNEVTRLARDAQRRKEEGGRDLLEEQGRWYKSSEVVMKGLLGVEA
ncbi:hypothetical protein H2198_008713 [Neophaeococcomyces mojaviensis]|uniref:Uncharacterized protein n=1 Tax=Neophaeococcomyces mojaviensis TaxID=3383035 RepID=A0ACC2ZX73_9EURO|nr:hypothetical protein H2198_008713 [Knufia sp. JES_112]